MKLSNIAIYIFLLVLGHSTAFQHQQQVSMQFLQKQDQPVLVAEQNNTTDLNETHAEQSIYETESQEEAQIEILDQDQLTSQEQEDQSNQTQSDNQVIQEQIDNQSQDNSTDELDEMFERIEKVVNDTFEEYNNQYLKVIKKLTYQLNSLQDQTDADMLIILKSILFEKEQELDETNSFLMKWNSQYGIQCYDLNDCLSCVQKKGCVWCQDSEVCTDEEKSHLCIAKFFESEECPAADSVLVQAEDQLISQDGTFNRQQNQDSLDNKVLKSIAEPVDGAIDKSDKEYLLKKKLTLEEQILVLQEVIKAREKTEADESQVSKLYFQQGK